MDSPKSQNTKKSFQNKDSPQNKKPSKKFDAVVLSGGGTNGILTLGSLHFYHELGKLSLINIKEYAGASIGSVICLLMVCGYTPLELFKEICLIDDFFEVKGVFNILHNIKNMGIMSIDNFIDRIKLLVLKKMGEIHTLKKLHEITGKKLYIPATDISNVKEIKYSYLTSPEMSCIEAVKHSCNIPIVFHKIKHNSNFIVDGGVSNNYPWDYISGDCKNILGIYISGSNSSFQDDTFFGYAHRIITTPIKILSVLRCELAPDKVKTIKLTSEKMSYINIDQNQKMNCFLKGYQETSEQESVICLYVKGWCDEYEYASHHNKKWENEWIEF